MDDNVERRGSLSDGWEYAIKRTTGRPLTQYFWGLSAPYSEDYRAIHGNLGRVFEDQPSKLYDNPTDAGQAMLAAFEAFKQQDGFPYPDKMYGNPLTW